MVLKKVIIRFILPASLLLLSIFFYSRLLDLYFFQDDFFEINISKATDLSTYFNFFRFRSDIIAYRPISLQNYFFLSSQLFGFNPIGFRLISISLLLINIYLILKIVSKISTNSKVGLLTGFFWATSSIHFLSIAWIAAAYNLIGTFFFLSTFLSFLIYLDNSRLKFYFLSIFLFLLTIGSFEFSVTFPSILLAYLLIVKKTSFKKTLKYLSVFIIISAIYLIFRSVLVKIPQIPEYQLTLNLNSLKAFFWYILWTFNVPEEFKKQVVDNLIHFNQDFLWQYWQLISIITTGVLWLWFTGVIYPTITILRQKIKLNVAFILFSFIWFVVGISPVLLLPNHNFIMYLTLCSIGVYMILSYLILKSKVLPLLVLSVIIWLFLSSTTMNFYTSNSYIMASQQTARNFKNEMLTNIPKLENYSSVYYPLDEVEPRQALMNDEAIRAIYNNQTLSIYYNKRDLIENYKKQKIKGFIYVFIRP